MSGGAIQTAEDENEENFFEPIRTRLYIAGVFDWWESSGDVAAYEDHYLGNGEQSISSSWPRKNIIYLDYSNDSTAEAALSRFAAVSIQSLTISEIQDTIPAKPHPRFPNVKLRIRYGLSSDPPTRTKEQIPDPELFKRRPERGEKKCEDFQVELLEYQRKLEAAFQKSEQERPATYDEIHNGKRQGTIGEKYSGVPYWGRSPHFDQPSPNCMMQPGCIFSAVWHTQNFRDQKELSKAEFYKNTVVTLQDGHKVMVNSKERHFICLQVFKGHCVAVPIFTYGGKGFVVGNGVSKANNTLATHIPIRDGAKYGIDTAPQQPHSRFGKLVLLATRKEATSAGDPLDAASSYYYNIHDKAVVHYAQLVTHIRRTRATVWANLTPDSFEFLIQNVIGALDPAWPDRVMGEPPFGPHKDVSAYPWPGAAYRPQSTLHSTRWQFGPSEETVLATFNRILQLPGAPPADNLADRSAGPAYKPPQTRSYPPQFGSNLGPSGSRNMGENWRRKPADESPRSEALDAGQTPQNASSGGAPPASEIFDDNPARDRRGGGRGGNGSGGRGRGRGRGGRVSKIQRKQRHVEKTPVRLFKN